MSGELVSGASVAMRCDQCGRVGTRGFRLFGGYIDPTYGAVPVVTECTGKIACRRRWKRPAPSGDYQGQTCCPQVAKSGVCYCESGSSS